MFCLLDLALALALSPQRVLVIGANGQTGSRVVRLLRDAPNSSRSRCCACPSSRRRSTQWE